MVNPTNNLGGIGGVGGVGSQPIKPAGAGGTTGTSFADMLKQSIGEVSKLQQDASKAVDDLATGDSNDMTGVMTAVEKSDMAFKTLLAIRSKLLDAYNEVKGLQV
jgi:flagellar hook-basal body complex protein FliE